MHVRWACGMTTVPMRIDSGLTDKTLESIHNGGFKIQRLFVDGICRSDKRLDKYPMEVTTRCPAIRTFGNWVLGLAELYIREPAATHYAMFQDDFVISKNVRSYLEQCHYPKTGYWNLYTFPSNQLICPKDDGKTKEGWFHSNQFGRGALALVFSKEAVVALLSHPHMVERPQDAIRGHRAIDGGIITAFRKVGWHEEVHNPSLVQHTGHVSSMGNKPHKQATSFRGEDFDALELLKR